MDNEHTFFRSSGQKLWIIHSNLTQPPRTEAARALMQFDPSPQDRPRLRTNFGGIRVGSRSAIGLYEPPDTSVRTHLGRRYSKPRQEKSASASAPAVPAPHNSRTRAPRI